MDYFSSGKSARNLLASAQQVALSQDIPGALNAILEMGMKTLGAQSGCAWVAPKGRIHAWAQSPSGEVPSELTAQSLELLVMTFGVPLVYSEGSLYDAMPLGPLPKRPGPYMGVPITIGTEIVGGIAFVREMEQEAFDEQDQILSEYLAAFLAVGISHSQIFHRADDAEQAKKMQSDYLATVAHDIRSPLTAIIGAVRILESVEGPEAEPFREMILSSAEHMERLVQSVLDMSRIEAGQFPLHKQPIHVSDTIIRLNTMLDNPYTLHLHDDPIVSLDGQRLEQVLLNLMTNGKKYGETGPKEIMTRVYQDKLHIIVQDTGPGLPDHIVKHMGERYLPSIKGIGLGLAIVVAVTEALGGKFTYQDRKTVDQTQGAQFILSFDL